MLTKVVEIKPADDFKLKVRFNDGTGGVHDFAKLVAEAGPMIEPLRDKTFFKRVFIEHGSPTWPNGFDIAPEWLHGEMAAARELHHDAAE
jgi:uncharacterized protein DUF2442